MDTIFKGKLPDGTYVIACGRRSRKRCSNCAITDAGLECDGCDKALCSSCAVSPRKGLDFCPRCFDHAWRHWLQIQPDSIAAMNVTRRRNEFRSWARTAAEKFLELARPLTAKAKATR